MRVLKKNFYFYRLVTPSTFEIFLLKLVPVQGSTFNGAVVGMSVKQWLQVVVPLKTYQKNTHQKKNDQKTNQQLSINHTINQTFQPPPTASKKRTRSHHVVAFDARALGASHMHDVHVRVDRRCAQSGKGSATHWKKKMEIEQQVK